MTGGQRGEQGSRFLQKLGNAKIHDLLKCFGLLFQALAQGRFGRNFLQSQGFLKKVVLAEVLNSREVAFAEAQQTNITAYHIGVGDGPLNHPGQLSQALAQTGETVDVQTDKSQAGMGSIEFVFGLFDNKTFHGNSPVK